MELKLTGIALNRPSNYVGDKQIHSRSTVGNVYSKLIRIFSPKNTYTNPYHFDCYATLTFIFNTSLGYEFVSDVIKTVKSEPLMKLFFSHAHKINNDNSRVNFLVTRLFFFRDITF